MSEASGYGALMVPRSVPTAARSSSAASLASLQLLRPMESGPRRTHRSPKLTHSMAVFSAEVITDNPSTATSSSTYSIPAAAHFSASESLIFREASEMSDSPEQNLAKPSPVPGPSTVIAMSGLASLNSLATAAVIGSTVDEPDTKIEPPEPPDGADVSFDEELSSPPQAARVTAAAATRAARCIRFIDVSFSGVTGSRPCRPHRRRGTCPPSVHQLNTR